mmetsp:Transcript_107563/g.304862  ORF Transcript_107563/g.304862 Transcript_107563/m.304862 type:complete len:266 (-) Transcript_107563:998-1795(-)
MAPHTHSSIQHRAVLDCHGGPHLPSVKFWRDLVAVLCAQRLPFLVDCTLCRLLVLPPCPLPRSAQGRGRAGRGRGRDGDHSGPRCSGIGRRPALHLAGVGVLPSLRHGQPRLLRLDHDLRVHHGEPHDEPCPRAREPTLLRSCGSGPLALLPQPPSACRHVERPPGPSGQGRERAKELLRLSRPTPDEGSRHVPRAARRLRRPAARNDPPVRRGPRRRWHQRGHGTNQIGSATHFGGVSRFLWRGPAYSDGHPALKRGREEPDLL